MKKIILICSMLVAQFALADGPQIEPGPVMKMGNQASKIARILLNRQLNKCLDEFQKDNVAITDVTAQNLAPKKARYQIKGVVLVGGDIATGQITLNIDESEQNGFGFNKVKVYSCQVLKD